MRRLLIRPGAIGDFIVSLPALEALCSEYTEVWCAGAVVPLARFADKALSIVSSGLDRVGLMPCDEVMERLRGFDSIVSWYGFANHEFREAVRDLPFRFFPALPDGNLHAVDFYNSQALEVGREAGAIRPSRFPFIRCPEVPRSFAAIHPFASSPARRAPMEVFEKAAARLGETMPVHWICGPEERLPGAMQIQDLYEVACWLSQARIFVGNDSGISHLAAAVGTPVQVFFQDRLGAAPARMWAPRGRCVNCSLLPVAS